MTDKAIIYEELLPQLAALLEGETDTTAILANAAALLHERFDNWLWTGFYVVKRQQESGTEELVLGPFQGPVACMHIGYGRGVCGAAWQQKETLVVPDVDLFPGHIACSSLSRSEIVVPIANAQGRVYAVLDIDSPSLSTFDDTDRRYLEQAAALISKAAF